MDWFHEYPSIILDPSRAHLSPVAEQAERRLKAGAARLENGGVYRQSSTWDDFAWGAACSVSQVHIRAAITALLAEWRGDDLVLLTYDNEGQHRVEKTRAAASKAASTRWARVHANADAPAHANADAPAHAPAYAPAMQSRVEKSRVEKKREEKNVQPAKAGRLLPPSPPAVELAKYLLAAIHTHHPEVKDGSPAWARDMELALKDGRTPEQLRSAIDFAHRSSKGEFWRGNVLSGATLRRHYDKLAIQAKGNGTRDRGLSAEELWAQAEELERQGL
jgi:hypothetical protein